MNPVLPSARPASSQGTRHIAARLAAVVTFVALGIGMGFPQALAQTVLSTDTTLGPADLALENQAVVVRGATLTLSGTHRFQSLILTNGATLTHPTNTAAVPHLVIATDFAVSADSAVILDGRGAPEGEGPGSGPASSCCSAGGSHGGAGGPSENGRFGSTHGSFKEPTSPGSGGSRATGFGDAGAGGGALRITAQGIVRIDGRVSAEGTPGGRYAGGGAGGSVWIETRQFLGSGSVSVNGGQGEERAGGGGGGRVAVYFETEAFAGAISACGAGSTENGTRGGAGTVYRKQANQPLGTLLIDNCGHTDGTTDLDPAVDIDAHVVVRGRGILAHRPGEAPATFRVTGNLTVESDGLVSATGRGFTASEGPGAVRPVSCCSAGGSHGGTGGVGRDGARAGLTYGSILEPVVAGSGGGLTTGFGDGGNGGGALKLIVLGTLRNEGRIEAEGDPGGAYAGGGAGGSLWIIAPVIAGNGVFSVAGGAGSPLGGGGGGGGRMALEYDQDTFTGSWRTYGGDAGASSQVGGAGTLHRIARSASRGLVILDNAGKTNGVTEVDREFTLIADLAIRSGAILATRFDTGLSTFRLLGDVHVESQGAISASGRGHPHDEGPGGALRSPCCTAGASHAGSGGHGRDGALPGANYGSPTEPSEAGSGAASSTAFGEGGDGGGALRLIIDGELRVDGRIEADGGQGGAYAGGGSGGSLWISGPRLAGAGTLSVAGGDGFAAGGGGGGGGRIALYLGQNAFTGSFATHGGDGIEIGGGGTTYLKLDASARGQLILDNGNKSNGVTEVDAGFSFTEDLLIRNGAILAPRAAGTPWILHFPANVHIAPGGAISATGRGLDGGEGEGAPATVPAYAAGGSHGGRGGDGDNHPAVTTHGSLTEPAVPGSGGGNATSFDKGGRGGGAIRLRVDGELRVDGRLEADGATGGNYAGGGSGGSVWINARHISGTGRISARGGNAFEANRGGGGGGGRIALYYDLLDDALRDQMTTGGGDGIQQGGGGTVFLKPSSSPSGELIVDRSPLDKDTAPTEFWGDVRVPGSLRIRSGAVVSHPPGHPFHLGVHGPMTLASGAIIQLDGLGYPAGTGPGGATNNAGAGHGDTGGAARNGPAGGPVYGNARLPIDLGSGAGNRAGGGAARLSVQGTLQLDGIISANAEPSTTGGGAAGGSIAIRASLIQGTGFLLAEGGNGDNTTSTGGGAGGRIALQQHGPAFDPSHLSVQGGTGWRPGGTGSVHRLVLDPLEPPRIESALASPTLTEVAAVFTDVLDTATAEDPGRYALSGSARVLAAKLQTDLQTVLLTTTPLQGGASYVLSVSGVRNGLGTPTPPGDSAPAFVARGTLRGFVRQETFTALNGSRLGDLYADPRWPASPSLARNVSRLAASRDDIDGNQLGARLTGYLVPETSGWHRFFLTSDDNGAFYLSEDHTPANLRLLASEPLRGFPGDWTSSTRPEVTTSRGFPPANVSSPVWLESGRHYWFDARFKEGTASEHLSVTWQGPQEPAPLPSEGTRLAGDRIALPAADSGPQILTPPVGGVFPLGATVTLRVEASGTAPLLYQWYRNGLPLPDAAGNALTLTNLSPSSLGEYRVRVSDAVGAVDSPVARIDRATPESPAFTESPASRTASLGETVVLSGLAEGVEPISYQWRLNGQEIPGARSPALRIARMRLQDAGTYTLVVSNPFGSLESDPASISVSLPSLPLADAFELRPVFTQTNGVGTADTLAATLETAAGEPRHADKRGGRSVWFSWRAPASGVATFSTAGSNFDTLLAVYTGTTLAALQSIAADDDSGGFLTSELQFNAVAGTQYAVALDGFANAAGSAVIAWELHTDAPPLPSILTQPASILGAIGDPAVFRVQFTPPGTTVQWLFNDRELPGQTEATLAIQPIVPSSAGNYRARLRSPQGALLESAVAVLEVTDRPDTAGLLSADKLDDLFSEAELRLPDQALLLQTTPLAGQGPVSIGLPGSQWTDNSQSGRSDEDPPVCNAIATATRWFRMRFNVPGAGPTTVHLTTEGSEIPTLLAVFTNRVALRMIACDAALPPGKTAAVQFGAVRGVDYLVLVDGVQGRRGTIKLNWNGEEETPALVTLQDNRLLIELRVAPAAYAWQVGGALDTWETVFNTNLPGGLFRYLDPNPATAPARFFRLVPVPPR